MHKITFLTQIHGYFFSFSFVIPTRFRWSSLFIRIWFSFFKHLSTFRFCVFSITLFSNGKNTHNKNIHNTLVFHCNAIFFPVILKSTATEGEICRNEMNTSNFRIAKCWLNQRKHWITYQTKFVVHLLRWFWLITLFFFCLMHSFQIYRFFSHANLVLLFWCKYEKMKNRAVQLKNKTFCNEILYAFSNRFFFLLKMNKWTWRPSFETIFSLYSNFYEIILCGRGFRWDISKSFENNNNFIFRHSQKNRFKSNLVKMFVFQLKIWHFKIQYRRICSTSENLFLGQ